MRNKVVWAKPNPMPTSVRDRLNCTWEPVYFLVRSTRYHFDLDAIREPHRSVRPVSTPSATIKYAPDKRASWAGPLAGANDGLLRLRRDGRAGHALGKNPGDCWALPTASYHGAHFATFPGRLVERPLRASCPERVCVRCGQPWERERARRIGRLAALGALAASCRCGASWRPGLILDPFFGAGTVGLVAEANQRDWLGIELNPKFAALAEERITTARKQQTQPDEAADAA